MFTIKKALNKNGYVISIGDRNPTFAKDADEISQAVQHYFGDHDKHEPELCPFCKQVANMQQPHPGQKVL